MENEQLKEIINNIQMYKIDSSNINYLGYDKGHLILKVIFKSGSTYAYFGVPEFIWMELSEAQSKGTYLRESVIKRNDMYKFIKL